MTEPQKTDEDLQELPEVAKNIFIPCKKCEANRYHKVIAHKTEKSAKVECEVCGSKKTFSIKKPKAAKKVRKTRSRKKPLYDVLLEEIGESAALNYNMKERFEEKVAIDHPKFGLGFVNESNAVKIQVVFSDETRDLVHNRS